MVSLKHHRLANQFAALCSRINAHVSVPTPGGAGDSSLAQKSVVVIKRGNKASQAETSIVQRFSPLGLESKPRLVVLWRLRKAFPPAVEHPRGKCRWPPAIRSCLELWRL